MDFDSWKGRPDATALSALLVSVESRVQRICRRILRNEHDAEEAKQEILLEIARDLGTVEDGARFDRWVGSVAFRSALDRRRAQLRRRARELQAAGRESNGSTRDDALHLAMADLDDDDRALLIERHFDRRTLREMGARRGISAVAVRKRIAGAQDRLKRMLGVIMFWGTAVKLKAALVAALLLMVGGGVWVARRPNLQPATLSSLVRQVPTASEPRLIVDAPIPVPATPSLDRRRDWTLEKLREYSARIAAYRQEVERDPDRRFDYPPELERQWNHLREQAALSVADPEKGLFDATACLEYTLSPEGAGLRSSLMHLLMPAINAEITSEDAPSGPLLRGLMTVVHGPRGDRQAFLYFAQNLRQSNRDIAEFAFECVRGAHGGLQEDAMSVLAVQGSKGNLKESITRNLAYLQQLAVEGPPPGSGRFEFNGRERIKSGAWAALSVVGTPETDEFLVQYIESRPNFRIGWAENLARAAPRVMTSHANRFSAMIREAADQPGTPAFVILRFSLQLPSHACLDGLRYVRSKFPAGEEEAVRGVDALIGFVESGQTAEAIAQMERLTQQGGGGLNLIRQLAHSAPK